MGAFLELEGLVVCTDASANFLKEAFLLCLPVLLTSLFEDSVKLFLGLFSSFLDGRDEVLFVCMTEVARDVRVLEGLEGGESGRGVEVGDGTGQRRCIDVSLGKEEISGKRMSYVRLD